MFRVNRRLSTFRFSTHFDYPIIWSAISWTIIN